MLKIVVPAWEDWDPKNEKFIQGREVSLTLEHSLVSVSKWEAKYHKSFTSNTKPTEQEMRDYIQFMVIKHLCRPNTEDIEQVCKHLSAENMREIEDYTRDSMTATTFSNRGGKKPGGKQIVTAELVYYWMISFNIPFECQHWHFNKLMTLIRICEIKNQPSKKMGRKEQAAQTRSLNAARRAKHHSRG